MVRLDNDLGCMVWYVEVCEGAPVAVSGSSAAGSCVVEPLFHDHTLAWYGVAQANTKGASGLLRPKSCLVLRCEKPG